VLDPASRDRVAEHVRAATGQDVAVVSGTLPRRVEVTFSPATATRTTTGTRTGPTPASEAASGYLHVLAFEDHLARHGLTPVRPTARQVVRGGTVFAPGALEGLTAGPPWCRPPGRPYTGGAWLKRCNGADLLDRTIDDDRVRLEAP
jgi:hypothetical protein